MKRLGVLLLLTSLAVILFTGCSKKTVGINFTAFDVERLEVHHTLYADGENEAPVYEKRMVTDSEDIAYIISSLEALRVGKDVSREKPTYDRPVLTFRFSLKGGTSYVLIYQRWMQGGGFVRTASLFHNVSSDDALTGLWEDLSYAIEPSSETEIFFTE